MNLEMHPFVTIDSILLINVRDGRKNVPVKVVKVNPSNYRCVDMGGLSYNVARTVNVRVAPDPSVWVEPKTPTIRMGMAVRFKDPTKSDMHGIFVVTDEKAGGFRVMPLGGTPNNRYYYNIQAMNLVPADDVNDLNV